MTTSNTPETGSIIIRGQEFKRPLIESTFGEVALDITGLYAQTGYKTHDSGFTSTALCESDLTFIDGEKGILLYRGYPIEQLAAKSDYVETVHLLLKGELPTSDERDAFEHKLRFDKDGNLRAQLNEQMLRIIEKYPRATPPMLVIGNMVSLLGIFDGGIDFTDPAGRDEIALNMVAKIPTIVATAYRYKEGKPIIYPRRDLDYTENFMRMCFADDNSAPYELHQRPSQALIRALDVFFMLHADHEQNASTSTVRLAGSTGVAPYAAVGAGVTALWGPKHGGANEAVLNMLKTIRLVENIPHYIARANDKDDPFKLMGFGHRVYKNFDPRATILGQLTHAILDEKKSNSPLLSVAKELEKRALADPQFKKNKWYPNVDFYSGICLQELGFPREMFTPLFALARVVGWVAQWNEMVQGGRVPIGRPRQIYMGPEQRDFVPIELRTPSRTEGPLIVPATGTALETKGLGA